MQSKHNHIFDYKRSMEYDLWFEIPENRFVFELEKKIAVRLLAPKSGERLLDIGCGTGNLLHFFAGMGLNVSGIDCSPYMLDIARKKLGHKAELYRGVAEDLPFDDNAFDISILCNVLEFVDDPLRALAEASRVTRNRIFLGVLNRFSVKGITRRIKGLFLDTVYRKAKFYSVGGLKKNVRAVLGNPPIAWRTVQVLPSLMTPYCRRIEQWPFLHRSPFGTFIGMTVLLVPDMRAEAVPLSLQYTTQKQDIVTGVTRDNIDESVRPISWRSRKETH
ncbi:MAG: methyltransferase domain-containing protein [Pseudomonadota bacterium]